MITKKDFELVRFPNGEFKLIALRTITKEIQWKYGSEFANGEKLSNPSEELVALIQLNEIVKKLWKDPECVYVYADYIPYKRQDKDTLVGEIKMNGIYQSNLFEALFIIEAAPHDVDRYTKETLDLYKKYIPNDVTIVFPDTGARKRFSHLMVNETQETIWFNKKRNPATGKLEFEKLEYEPTKEKAVIVDDIIAYGGTFIHVAKVLKKSGVKHITLLLNHADTDKDGLPLYDKNVLKKAGIKEIIIMNGDL